MFRFSAIFTMLLFTLISNNTWAHSEHDKARFVAPQGQDIGQCDNVLRPCKTIAYAVKQANKGDRVLVAAGQYDIAATDELFYLKSALVPIMGGYNRFDHFQSQSPQSNISTLTNIPVEMAGQLRKQGFTELSDGKSFKNNKALSHKISQYQQLSKMQQSTLCQEGKADVFSCKNIDLLAHTPLSDFSSRPAQGSDIWGHVDLNNNNEYAIMTTYNGATIFDVTNPEAPVEVGSIAGVDSSWRDVKVYQYYDQVIEQWKAYAYVTSERSRTGTADYVTIIDLNSLPNSVSLVEKNKVVSKAHNIYITNIDYTLNIALPNTTPSLQLIGATSRGGAFQNYSLSDPATLVASSGNYFGNGYTHDGSSLSIDDQRAINDCNITEGACTVFIDFNENELKLWNISDQNNVSKLGEVSYSDVPSSQQYIHSGWGTEDKQFILLHDEFDENKGGLNTTVRIFSIEDLNTPVQVGQWTGETKAIDHNGFVRGNRYYMSNYTRGLTELDITDPTTPIEVGFFDTFPTNDDASFNGAWGVYPFLPSGNILISDINGGLYVLKDNTKSSVNGEIGFTSNIIESEQGVMLNLAVQRLNAETNSTSTTVSYQVIAGSAKQGEDFVVDDGTLTWAANDNNDKVLNIDIASDLTGKELPESFFIRLYNPTNSATLAKDSYVTVKIAGVVDNGAGSFVAENMVMAENQQPLVIDVNRIGSTLGEISYSYQLVSNEAELGSDFEENSGVITWQDGENATKQITIILINDDLEEQDETFSLVLSSLNESRLGAYSNVTITIADDDKNNAPTITLDENFQVNTSQTVSLVAEAADSENDAMTYVWQQTAGDSINLSNETTLIANFVAPATAGELTFEFTATDFRAANAAKSITITVVAPVTPPPVQNSGGGGSGGGSMNFYLLAFLFFGFLQKYAKTKQLTKHS